MSLVYLLRVLTRKKSYSLQRVQQSKGRWKLSIEMLECRRLLAVAPIEQYAEPFHELTVTDFADNSGSNGAVTPNATASPSGLTVAQVRHAYGFDKIAFNGGTVAGDGTGTTIAIVDAYDDPNIANDLKKFDAAFGLPDPVFTKVNQTGGSSMPAANGGWATEIALDVEWSHAIAPKANILLVEASSNSYSNLMAAVDYARRATGVVSVSMSWGGGEFSSESTYNSYFTTPSGHAGVSFLASSGDTGSPVGYPAISPNVVGVGGTTLNVDSSGNYLSEAGWSGSGGGISGYVPKPSYQSSIATQSSTFRTNPDISYDSNPSTGFPVYDSYNNPATKPWGQWGGTSAAAPQMAALVAIADQGLALAGKNSLDGATQLLPALYRISASDFHDVTAGTSTGSPNFAAGSGYDLVTGRGTPYANLVVNDLVGSGSVTTPPPTNPPTNPPTTPPVSTAATHFTLTSSDSMPTAGGSFNLTVTALDASNKPVTNYTGTVHFTSTDSKAVLPVDYTFTTADNGTHTFNRVTTFTSWVQYFYATDITSAKLTGYAPILVMAAAPDHLDFSQQPLSTGVGAAISPVVTVSIQDVYNNLEMADSTDKITLALGSNSGSATLGGTTTLTVKGGVATFSDLSVNKVGTGYSLMASSGALPKIASSNFDISATVLGEGFETGNLSSYYEVGWWGISAAVSTAAKHDGKYGLALGNSDTWIFRNDAATQVKQGDTVSVWFQFSGKANGTASFGFGATANGTLSINANASSNTLQIQSNRNYGTKTIASVSQTWLPNHWYRLEVQWGVSGGIIGNVYDSNGTSLLKSVSGSATGITSGGIAFKANGSGTKLFDTVTLAQGVNHFAVASAGATAADHGDGISGTAYVSGLDDGASILNSNTSSRRLASNDSTANSTALNEENANSIRAAIFGNTAWLIPNSKSVSATESLDDHHASTAKSSLLSYASSMDDSLLGLSRTHLELDKAILDLVARR